MYDGRMRTGAAEEGFWRAGGVGWGGWGLRGELLSVGAQLGAGF